MGEIQVYYHERHLFKHGNFLFGFLGNEPQTPEENCDVIDFYLENL